MTPYEIYVAACKKYKCEPIGEDWHTYYIKESVRELEIAKNTSGDKYPYVIRSINQLVMKVKLIGEELEINYFNEEQFTDIISKYKEE